MAHSTTTSRISPAAIRRSRGRLVDPWHAASDEDHSRGDQVGFDFFFHSGVTRGLPTMVPIAMLYATPEDAANEVAYLYKRHYPISYVEMGEEADGQHMLPEDYAALYVQFATAIHKLVPEAKLGGPPFEGTYGDVEVWPDANGKVSWIGRFLDYLKAHGRMNDFTSSRSSIIPIRIAPVIRGPICIPNRNTFATLCRSGKTMACRRIFPSS